MFDLHAAHGAVQHENIVCEIEDIAVHGTGIESAFFIAEGRVLMGTEMFDIPVEPGIVNISDGTFGGFEPL